MPYPVSPLELTVTLEQLKRDVRERIFRNVWRNHTEGQLARELRLTVALEHLKHAGAVIPELSLMDLSHVRRAIALLSATGHGAAVLHPAAESFDLALDEMQRISFVPMKERDAERTLQAALVRAVDARLMVVTDGPPVAAMDLAYRSLDHVIALCRASQHQSTRERLARAIRHLRRALAYLGGSPKLG